MWTSVILKLKAIEDSLARQGKYVDNFDAMSLASVETAERVDGISSPLSFSPTTQLKGLTKLVADISAVLHEAYIEQQGALILAYVEIDKCRHFAESNAADFSGTVANSENDVSSHFVESGSSFHDRNAAGLEKKAMSNSTKKANTARSDALHRHFKALKQELHNNLTDILDAKLVAHEVISSSMDMYLKFIVKIALENGVLDPLQRAKCIVQPQQSLLLTHKFLDTSETNTGLTEIRNLWAKAYFHDDMALAERNLCLNQNSLNRFSSRAMTKFKMGAGLTLVLWSFSECFNNEQIGKEIWRDPTFAIFMCFGDLLLLLWMWGVSMRVWRKAGIDFTQLLGLEITEVEGQKRPEAAVYSSATDLSLIFLIIFISFNKAVRGVFNIEGSRAFAHILPIIMTMFFVYRAVYPITSRAIWIKMMRDVLIAPFSPVTFRDGYIGDLLTSLVRVFIPLCFSFAYLIMSAYAWLSNNIQAASSTSDLWWQESFFYRFGLVPLITLYPLWIRLMQCLRKSVETGKRFPYMANACKYASAIAVISYGSFRPHLREDMIWIACFVLATIFQFTWDLTMDWGMLVKSTSKSASDSSFLGISLRKTRLLGPHWLYITVIISNFFLRFAWALTLLPDNRTNGPKTFYAIILFHLTPLVAALEVVRRMVWGFFRLEFEQLETFGCPDTSSVSFYRGSHKSFDKMEIGASRSLDTADSIKDIKNFTSGNNHGNQNGQNGQSGHDQSAEWVLIIPFISTFSDYILRFGVLPSTSSIQMKARFVESVYFSIILLCVIFSAALPHAFS